MKWKIKSVNVVKIALAAKIAKAVITAGVVKIVNAVADASAAKAAGVSFLRCWFWLWELLWAGSSPAIITIRPK